MNNDRQIYDFELRLDAEIEHKKDKLNSLLLKRELLKMDFTMII